MKTEEIYKIISRQYRCPKCNRLLFKGKIRGQYYIETKCYKCGNIVAINNNSIMIKQDSNLTTNIK